MKNFLEKWWCLLVHKNNYLRLSNKFLSGSYQWIICERCHEIFMTKLKKRSSLRERPHERRADRLRTA